MARDEAYYTAEKKIEEALKSSATELDLSGKPPQTRLLRNQSYPWLDEDTTPDLVERAPKSETQTPFTSLLTELPESLGNLTQLQSLNLAFTGLSVLPNWLSKLTRLQSLNLANSRQHSLPDWLGDFKQLQYLDLSNNPLETLPASLLNLQNLISLKLVYMEPSVLSELLGQLTQLRSLVLAKNRLTTLPEWLGKLTNLQELNLNNNKLSKLPDWIGEITQLKSLNICSNHLEVLPKSVGNLANLQKLNLYQNSLTKLPDSIGNLKSLIDFLISRNKLVELPESICNLHNLERILAYENQLRKMPEKIGDIHSLKELRINGNKISTLPESLGKLYFLERLDIGSKNYGGNKVTDLPPSLAQLEHLKILDLNNNPLNPELAKAYEQGLNAVKAYLRAKAKSQITLNEAKLILVGEGEVGKTCLMDALLGKPWQEHPSTHGIEIQRVKVIDPDTNTEITLNSWDFGGQRVYRPTHQLFFSAPAVYLVVWKPREGPQQGFVKEWIQLIKRREPTAKILVVATHGGPQQRQPDIDRQELWDLFGKDMVVDFFHVESKPDKKGERRGIEELKCAIARVAITLPEVGRSIPKRWEDVHKVLEQTQLAYLSLERVLGICRKYKMDDEEARLFITIEHRLGTLIHYQHDPILRDIVVLKPDWLATAISYVLDDAETRNNQGLVKFSRLGLLWNDPVRPADTRYPETLHRIFLRLMERFDLSYRVAGLSKDEEANPVSLIAQLVSDTTPRQEKLNRAWMPKLVAGDIQQTQICRIVDAGNGQSANAEGLFYQLIVRLHKFSLGRTHWDDSVHWQRGLVLDADYNGRALLRHIGNDVHITVRAPFPERFLGMLTEEVKYLVESFWEGLRCDVTVPCLNPNPCKGLFEVSKLIENKKRGRPEMPCSICNEWQSIDQLLSNAPAATQVLSLETLGREFAQIKDRLDEVNDNTRRILSQVDKQYSDLIQIFTDEAKEGPRLFSFFPLDGNKFNPQTWIRAKFRLVLWCEHSRLPLPAINGIDSKKGVYDLELDREWFKQAVPYLKFLTGTLSLVLPVMSSTFKAIDDTAFKTLESQLNFGKDVIDAIAGEGAALNEVMGATTSTDLESGVALRAENATLRELHTLLKAKDPGFGGLIRVMNKRQEFLWVHEKFTSEY